MLKSDPLHFYKDGVQSGPFKGVMKIKFGLYIWLPKGERVGHIYLLLHIVNSLKIWSYTISFHLILFGYKPGKNSRTSEL